MRYRIYSKDGTDFGTFDGATPEAAFLALVRDAGYSEPNKYTGTVDDWIIEPIDERIDASTHCVLCEVPLDECIFGEVPA